MFSNLTLFITLATTYFKITCTKFSEYMSPHWLFAFTLAFYLLLFYLSDFVLNYNFYHLMYICNHIKHFFNDLDPFMCVAHQIQPYLHLLKHSMPYYHIYVFYSTALQKAFNAILQNSFSSSASSSSSSPGELR